MDERVTCSDGWASVDGDTFCCCIVAGPLIVSCPLAVGSKCWRLWADDVVSSPFSASLICCPEDSVDVDEDVDKVASPSTVELSPLGTKFILITAALGPSFLLASSCSSVFFRGFSAARIPLSTSCCSTVDPPFFSRCFPPFHPVSHRRKKETTTRQEKKTGHYFSGCMNTSTEFPFIFLRLRHHPSPNVWPHFFGSQSARQKGTRVACQYNKAGHSYVSSGRHRFRCCTHSATMSAGCPKQPFTR